MDFVNEYLEEHIEEEVATRIKNVLHQEEISSQELFMSLDDADFKRLNLTTKLIKIIKQIQKHIDDNTIYVEEYIDDENVTSAESSIIRSNDDMKDSEIADNQSEQPDADRDTNQNEIDVDIIFSKTNKGRQLMELLKEATKPTDKLFTQTTHILCDYLKAVYGLRPSANHKDILAISLVKCYPILASRVNPDCLQSVFFHRNARANGGHAGKIQNRMETMAKADSSRLFVRKPRQQSESSIESGLAAENSTSAEEMLAMLNELKFIVPNSDNKKRILELWSLTYDRRNLCRKNQEMFMFLKEYPASISFDGELISYDYIRMYNIDAASMFHSSWPNWMSKSISRYPYLYREIGNAFLRALAVIRLKNPNRGSKRARQLDEAKENPLKGIIDWIHDESELPNCHAVPALVIRSNLFDKGYCYLCWNTLHVPVGEDIECAFIKLLQCFEVFGINCNPADKLFFNFFYATIFNTHKITTTGEKFVISLS
ncbi:uncharacterized protein LOC129742942 [Uranotaenia lowii]|uniref:uncharacterized protein LOC129742942 n=1 Tax=Uranotaenia lowii TaxID=190385 RepID=UPI00247950B2|nr:uncharacterized protein LOC129742942 [Uranotaenia lowii]